MHFGVKGWRWRGVVRGVEVEVEGQGCRSRGYFGC